MLQLYQQLSQKNQIPSQPTDPVSDGELDRDSASDDDYEDDDIEDEAEETFGKGQLAGETPKEEDDLEKNQEFIIDEEHMQSARRLQNEAMERQQRETEEKR